MFTWICPQCGREVPPAYNECPDCAAKAAGAAAPPPDQPPPQQPGAPPPSQQPQYPPPQYQQPPYPQQPYPPPQYQQPPYPQQQYPPQPPYAPPQYQQPYPPQYPPPQYQQPVYGQPPYAPPPQFQEQPQTAPPPPPPPHTPMGTYDASRSPFAGRVADAMPPSAPPPAPEPSRDMPRGSSLFTMPPIAEKRGPAIPTWLLTVLCTAGFALLVLGAYWLFGSHRAATTPSATVESPAAKAGVATSPWQKFIEVSGVRLSEDPKHKDRILVKFLLTNHSETDLRDLAGNVTIWAGTKKSDEDAQGSFAFKTDVGPYDSKEITEPFNTKLKVYELPDWNVMSTDLQITSPAGSGSGGLP